MAGMKVKRVSVMSGLNVPEALRKPFQRPMLKRRAYDKNADRALKVATLGQRKRSGMHKLLNKKFMAPGGFVAKKKEHGSDSDSSSDEEVADDRPFDPLVVWVSPEEGGEAKGIPDKVMTVKEPDEFGIERTVTKKISAPESAYSKKSVEVPGILAKWLRPHQREGVQFLYECVMSLRSFEGAGCILADDMGLGKTLQSVCLIYTLLKTGITADGKPTAKRVIVTCPCSLVKNWDNEFVKWLGPGAVKTLAIAEQGEVPQVPQVLARFRALLLAHTSLHFTDRKTVEKNIDCFVKTNLFNVLILSYECLRTHVGRLNKTDDACDLFVADEAHRLKNRENQTSMALNSLKCKRRILLSGTPMQNDLEEFFAMVDFTNRGVLGTPEDFRRKIRAPILRGRGETSQLRPL